MAQVVRHLLLVAGFKSRAGANQFYHILPKIRHRCNLEVWTLWGKAAEIDTTNSW